MLRKRGGSRYRCEAKPQLPNKKLFRSPKRMSVCRWLPCSPSQQATLDYSTPWRHCWHFCCVVPAHLRKTYLRRQCVPFCLH